LSVKRYVTITSLLCRFTVPTKILLPTHIYCILPIKQIGEVCCEDRI